MIRFYKDIKKYWRYIVYSARAQLKNDVAGSFLNWLWWILDPLLFMCVYTFVYTVVFGKSQQYLCSFIFIGYSTWQFFDKTINASVKIIKNYRSILSKVYLPKFVLLISTMFVNGFKMLISFWLVLLSMMLYHVPITIQILWIIPYILLLFILCFGLGCVLLHFGVYVQDLANIVRVILRLMFYMSGIFYNPEVQLKGLARYLIIRVNPTCFIITQIRNSVLYGHIPLIGCGILWCVVALSLCALGVHLIYKYERRYVKSI